MPEENGNGKNGNRVGLLERVKAGVKEDVQSLKTDLPAKAKEQVESCPISSAVPNEPSVPHVPSLRATPSTARTVFGELLFTIGRPPTCGEC